MVVRAEVVIEPTGKNVERILDAAFQKFGLSTVMRSDTGRRSLRRAQAD